MQYPSVTSYPGDVPCPGPHPPSDLFNHFCDLCPFSYHKTYSFPFLLVRLLACSLLGWCVPMFPRRMSLLEVCMSYILLSSGMCQCYQ